MRSVFDTSPLLRSSIGFDRINRALEAAQRLNGSDSGYPPYNIEKLSDDRYGITMAVAGFTEDDLEVTVTDDTLVISGETRSETAEEDKERSFLHRGIAQRAFERRFQLADTIKVVGARLENGLLHVELEREIPDERKPRQIPITVSAEAAKVIDQKAA